MRLTETQWKVMNEVWRNPPASARDVLEALEGRTGWAYTTVKTILDRLVEKGALKVRMRANTNLYEPLVTRQEARRSEVRSLMDRAFDGAFGPLVHFLLSEEKLSEKDRAELKRLLSEQEEEGGGA